MSKSGIKFANNAKNVPVTGPNNAIMQEMCHLGYAISGPAYGMELANAICGPGSGMGLASSAMWGPGGGQNWTFFILVGFI